MEVLSFWLNLQDKTFYSLGTFEISRLLVLLQPIFEDPDPPSLRNYPLKPWFYVIKEKYPIGIRLKRNRVSLPFPMLIGETAESFFWYEDYYQDLVTGRDINGLDNLCGVLLRESGLAFSKIKDDQTDATIALLADLPLLKFYVYWWYYCTRKMLIDRYKAAFNKSGGSGKGPDFTSQYRWWGVAYAIAQDGPWRDIDHLKQSEIHDFLDYLDYHANYMKELEWKEKFNGTTG